MRYDLAATARSWGPFVRDYVLSVYLRDSMFRHWPLGLTTALLMVIVLGAGTSFGLPYLFWRDPGTAQVLWSALAFAVCFAVLGWYAFLLRHMEPQLGATVHEDWLRHYPLPHRDRARPGVVFAIAYSSCWVLLALLTAMIWEVWQFLSSHPAESWGWVALGVAVPAAAWFLLCFFVLAGSAPETEPRNTDSRSIAAVPAFRPARAKTRWRLTLLFFGLLVGFNLLLTFWPFGPLTRRPSLGTVGAVLLPSLIVALRGARHHPDGEARRAHMAGMITILVVLLVLVAIAASGVGLSAATALAVFGIMAGTLYFVVRGVLGMTTGPILCLLAAAGLVSMIGRSSGFSGPEVRFVANPAELGKPDTSERAEPQSMDVERPSPNPSTPERAAPPKPSPIASAGPEPAPEPAKSLDRDYEGVRPPLNGQQLLAEHILWNGPKPLVVIAASGGGISAAVWTASVLAKLEEKYPEFPYHVRIITGASGGLLGASAYAASIDTPLDEHGTAAPPTLMASRATELRNVLDGVSADSLSELTTALALHDVPSLFLPFRRNFDRGDAIERRWVHNTGGLLGTTFGQLRDREIEGWMPSLIFPPMIVDSGDRLILSNLDLDELFTHRAIGPDGRPSDPDTDAVQLASLDRDRFDRMPVAHAARLASSFPFVSPAGRTAGFVGRLVDAGYFDNHGIDIACRWIVANRQWINQNASQVMILNIRTYPDEPNTPGAVPSGLALEEAMTPAEGALAGRAGSMASRNGAALEWVAQHFRDAGLPPVSSMVIQCPIDGPPLSWYLTRAQSQRIRSAVDDGAVQTQLNLVVEWIRGGNPWRLQGVMARVRDTLEIRIATSQEESGSWMLYRNQASELDGCDIAVAREVVRRIGRYLGVELAANFVEPVPWEYLLSAPDRGDAEMVVSLISFRPERESLYHLRFSTPYHQATLAWAIPPGSPDIRAELTSGAFTRLRSIVVQEETTARQFAASLVGPAEAVSILPVDSPSHFALRLEAALDEGAGVILADEPYVEFLNRSRPADQRYELVPVDPALLRAHAGTSVERSAEFYSIGVPESSPELLWLVNRALHEMAVDGSLQAIITRYRNAQPTPNGLD